ncbi:Ras guanine nucleotide exchange factor domain containing protein [Amanita muscaria]
MALLMHPGLGPFNGARPLGRTRASVINPYDTSSNAGAVNGVPAQQQHFIQYPQEEELDVETEEPFQSLFCRALYDYESQDNSALSFRRGDIIEVLSQQPSGWWDGLLGDERGWFPSNYVVIISEEEAEQAFTTAASEVTNQSAGATPPAAAAAIYVQENVPLINGAEVTPTASIQFGRVHTQPQAQQQQDTNVEVDLSHALLRGGLVQTENQHWMSDSEGKYKQVNGHGGSTSSLSSQLSDFWMPQVTPDNQIYYLNTHTGQQSRDFPLEAEEEAANSELSSFASQSSSRTKTSSALPYRHSHSNSSGSDQNIAGFDFFNRSGTPEPWIKRLADDGYTYYYFNKSDGSVQWTRPELNGAIPRDRGESVSQSTPLSPTQDSINKFPDSSQLSVYSDDSDMQSVVTDSRKLRSNDAIKKKGPTSTSISKGQETSAERIAKSLQQALAPPPPRLVTDLSAAAKFAIQAVVENIRPNDLTRRSEDDRRMDDLINYVVHAVRDLLYVSAAPTGHIPSSALPPGCKDYKLPSQSPLKPAQRKVTATLSRLVLSARAMQYDSGATVNDTISRIQSDAEELEKAVLSFVLEVQRTQHTSDARPLKRLAGVFSAINIGLGLIGAGAAGTWKGFGWVPLSDDQNLPKRLLTPDVTSELGSLVSRLEETTTSFSYALRVLDESSADQIHVRGQNLITELSSILSFVADIHIARHVDVDGVLMDGSISANEIYAGTVEKARSLVRGLEASIQAAYDDGMALVMTTQSISGDEFGQNRAEKGFIYERLDTLCLSLKANMDHAQQILEALLAIGHEQADTAQGEYTGSIEWRLSKLSMIRQDDDVGFTDEDEDVVDMEYAMNRGIMAQSLANQIQEQEDEELSAELEDDDQELINEVDKVPVNHDDDVLDKSPPRQNASKSKLARIFGDEYADKVAKDSQPWYLQANYDSNDILLDSDGTVRSGTLAALVERLTSHDQMDTSYSKTFLLTFKSFTTADELFDLLVARFRIQPPANLTPEELPEWEKLKQRVIQIRVLNTLKAMITDDDVLDKEDMALLDRMLEFLKSDEVRHLNAAIALIKNIERIKAGGDALKQTQTNPGAPPPPMIPKTNKKLKLLDIEPLELARQLTIKESELYRRIKPIECLLRAREQKSENVDNIATVIQTSNRIADWVAESILSKEDSRKRGTIVKHLITVADRCRTLNNFSSMIAITSGLNTPPIRRLKRTWEQVNQRTMAQFAACEATIDSKGHFREYRRMMQTVNPPCVPFIGVFLTDLQFIHDGNPDTLPGGLINFRKRHMLSEVIGNIKRWQAQPFNLATVPVIMTYVEESLSQFTDTKASSDLFWDMSMEREPREREDEKMARLLHESGFL